MCYVVMHACCTHKIHFYYFIICERQQQARLSFTLCNSAACSLGSLFHMAFAQYFGYANNWCWHCYGFCYVTHKYIRRLHLLLGIFAQTRFASISYKKFSVCAPNANQSPPQNPQTLHLATHLGGCELKRRNNKTCSNTRLWIDANAYLHTMFNENYK